MERVRQSGYADGGREAKLMLLLSETVSELSYRPAQHRTRRRVDLFAQRAIDREIDAWEMSCRIRSSVMISASKSSRR
jgi:hypothetical protein